MPDYYDDTDYSSGSGNSIAGAIIAPFLGLMMLWFGSTQAFQAEGKAVRVEKALNVGKQLVQPLNNGNAASLQDKIVYVSGEAKAHGAVTDPATNVSAPVLRLVRNVQMYQWQEKEDSYTSGGHRHHTYEYYKTWSNERIDSNRFEHRSGHENPQMAILKQGFEAPCKVDGHSVPAQLLCKVPAGVPLRPIPSSLNLYKLTSLMRSPCCRWNDEVYVGQNPQSPQVGDLRISYSVTPLGALSVVAAEHGNSFTPYVVSDGDEAVYLIEFGKVPVERMFKDALNDNQLHLWGMRFLWWLVNWIGLVLVFYPLKAITGWIPFVGQMVGAALLVLCAAGAFFINGIIIVCAWVYFRPVFAAIIFGSMVLVGALALGAAKPHEEPIR